MAIVTWIAAFCVFEALVGVTVGRMLGRASAAAEQLAS